MTVDYSYNSTAQVRIAVPLLVRYKTSYLKSCTFFFLDMF